MARDSIPAYSLDSGNGKTLQPLSSSIISGSPNANAASEYGTFDRPISGATKLALVSVIILAVDMFEHFAMDTFNSTQVLFIENLKMNPELNDGMQFARDRVYMVFLLLCAKLGDCGLGRFWTILLGSTFFFLGMSMVSAATHPWLSRLVWYMIGAFAILPFSQAAVRANIVIFGVEQFDGATETGRWFQDRFFWWLNVAEHSGQCAADLLLAWYGISFGVSQYLTGDDWVIEDRAQPSDYYTVFVVSAVSFLLTTISFAWGRQYFSSKSFDWLPSSSIVGLTQYLVKISSHCSFQGGALLTAKVVGITVYVSQAVLFWSPSFAKPLSFCSAGGVVFSIAGIIIFCQNVDWLKSVERPENQPLTVTDVGEFLTLLPLLVSSQIAYGCLYMMMKTWYVRQACQMDLRFDRNDFRGLDSPQMFTGFFSLYYYGVVIVLTPVATWKLNSKIENICARAGLKFGDWARYLFGMMFGFASAFAAAFCEVSRRAAPVLNYSSNCAPEGVGVRDMSAYWMLVPYMLMGACSLYAQPALLRIAYFQVPVTMRSMTMVTYVFMMSASESVVMAVSLALKEHTPHNLDTGHLEYLYFAFMGVSLLLFIIFSGMALRFEDRHYGDVPLPAA